MHDLNRPLGAKRTVSLVQTIGTHISDSGLQLSKSCILLSPVTRCFGRRVTNDQRITCTTPNRADRRERSRRRTSSIESIVALSSLLTEHSRGVSCDRSLAFYSETGGIPFGQVPGAGRPPHLASCCCSSRSRIWRRVARQFEHSRGALRRAADPRQQRLERRALRTLDDAAQLAGAAWSSSSE